MKLKNKTYDFFKALVTKWLPALGVLYVALAKIWGLPYPAEVEGTILAICLFIGTVMNISSENYYNEVKGG